MAAFPLWRIPGGTPYCATRCASYYLTHTNIVPVDTPHPTIFFLSEENNIFDDNLPEISSRRNWPTTCTCAHKVFQATKAGRTRAISVSTSSSTILSPCTSSERAFVFFACSGRHERNNSLGGKTVVHPSWRSNELLHRLAVGRCIGGIQF